MLRLDELCRKQFESTTDFWMTFAEFAIKDEIGFLFLIIFE